MADEMPIFKNDSPFDRANYRLTSLLPSLSKVFENIVYHEPNSFFD